MINFKQFYSLLKEGGGVFKNHPTQRILLPDIEPTIKFLSDIVGFNLDKNLLGSTGKRDSSGDIDIAIPLSKMSKDDMVDKLTSWCAERNFNPKDYIAKSGISVHFRTPIPNTDQEFVQTDFMFVENLKFAKFVYSNDEQLPFYGRHRAIVLSNLAKNLNLKFSLKGVTDRSTNTVIENEDPDRVAQILLNDNSATKKDIKTIRSILTFLIKKYKNSKIVEAMLSTARETILADGVDIMSLIQTKLTESIDKGGDRVGVQHLYSEYKPNELSMNFENFCELVDVLQETNGIIEPGNASITEKADGLAVRFGLTEDDKFFLQGSYSGPVFDGDFENKIKHEPTRNAFEKNFQKIKTLVFRTLKECVKKHDIHGVRVQAEWLYSPFALTRKEDPRLVYFVGTNYEKDKLGTWSTFALIDITDYNGYTLPDDIKQCIEQELTDLSTNKVKILPLNVDVFTPIDLSIPLHDAVQAIKVFKGQHPDYLEILNNPSRKRVDQIAKKELRQKSTLAILPHQREMHNIIINSLSEIQGKLGDYEGLVIKLNTDRGPFIFKVISPTYHKNRGRI